MKTLFCFVTSILLISSCHDSQPHMRSFDPGTIFSQNDAQLILGTHASSLKSSAGISPEGLASCETKYDAVYKDSATGKTASLIIKYAEFASEADADSMYAAIKRTDEGKAGMKELQDIGDEAYFNTDDSTFYYLQLRKKNKTFQMSLYPITSTVSREQFLSTSKAVSKRISDSLGTK